MANKSSFMLAILFIANPFMLLFFQNCSVLPKVTKTPASVTVEAPKASIQNSQNQTH